MSFLDFREPVSAWSHCAGMLLAVPGTFLLWRRSAAERTKRVSLLIYGLTLAFCYLASTLYHGVRLPASGVAAFGRLDRAGIFALIAGSYTPLAWCLLRGHWRRWTLVVVWSIAGTAAIMLAAGRQFSPGVSTCVYLGMGWGAIACYFESRRPCRIERSCRSSSAVCLTASGPSSTSCTGRSSFPERSAPTSSFTSSFWGAAWLITSSCSKSSRHSARQLDRDTHARR